ncbi:transglycosylase domain-containing protein [Roseospira goensis]|uniref:Penicillin-binding protein 1A n=1 Tax=Roseospira goensis TaxID=391922 RepID=A0A7W6WK32_9PROT|nr:PBP1A family penicillin-binding protein [Roseospira goensis]MBB4285931.1 penicillin-binding protein 1A [Roseospira goensis]
MARTTKGGSSGGPRRGEQRRRRTASPRKAPARAATGRAAAKKTPARKPASPPKTRPKTPPARSRTPPAKPAARTARGRRAPARRRGWPSRLWRLTSWTLVGTIWTAVALALLVGWYAYDLPDVREAATRVRPAGITVLADDGTPLAVAGEVHGETVTVATLPPALIQAVLATEDRRFYHHWGVDPFGIARAIVVNLRAGAVVQGGSTITQQVAKTLFLSHDRTLRRKVQELLLALWLEATFSKDQILGLYLNRVYLGAGTYGMDAAARRFFRRPATAVGPYQAAVLAGLMKAPSRLNPAANPDLAHARAREVLGNMVEAGYLEAATADRLAREGRPTLALARGAGAGGRYFGAWVLGRVDGYVGAVDRDLVVETTLRPAAQAAAEAALAAVLDDPDVRARGATQGAVVVLDRRGAVLAMVGGRDWAASPFNRAAQARRQPGSAFKPVVWLAGLEAGLTPDSVIEDAPVTVRGWSPRNHDNRYRGPVTLTTALAQSVNTVAVRIAEHAGRDRVARVARRLGLTTVDTTDPSMALGTIEVSPLDMTAAYAPFANGGRAVLPHGVVRIRDRSGAVVHQRRALGEAPRVVSAAHEAAIRRMLRAVVTRGTGRAAQPAPGAGLSVFGKTGTTQAFRDAWFVGFVETAAGGVALAGVWIGDDQGRPMDGLGGGGPAAAVFRDLFARWRP